MTIKIKHSYLWLLTFLLIRHVRRFSLQHFKFTFIQLICNCYYLVTKLNTAKRTTQAHTGYALPYSIRMWLHTAAWWHVWESWNLHLGREWGRRGGSDREKKERGALGRWIENEDGIQSEKCFKTYLLVCHHQASVRLWTTSRKLSCLPFSFFPTQPCGTNRILHFHLCWDLNTKKVCCCSEKEGILLPSRFALHCGTWSGWSLTPPFLS